MPEACGELVGILCAGCPKVRDNRMCPTQMWCGGGCDLDGEVKKKKKKGGTSHLTEDASCHPAQADMTATSTFHIVVPPVALFKTVQK